MTERVPFADLQAAWAEVEEATRARIDAVLADQRFILGDTVTGFEDELAAWLGLDPGTVIGVSSGTDALLAALMAVGVGPGDEVLTTPFSFVATVSTIVRLGARPVFVDVDPDSLNLDVTSLESLDPERFKAVVPVHLFGRCVDVETIRHWVGDSGAAIIEDAAQAIGTVDPAGRPCGALGHVGCLSFFPSKNLGAAGDAGAVVATDPELGQRLRALRVHGSAVRYQATMVGGNFRLDAIQAAYLAGRLPRLRAWNASRFENARYYDERFRSDGLDAVVRLPDLVEDGTWNAHQYALRCPRRDDLRAFLRERDVASAIYYPVPFHQMDAFASLGYGQGDFPEAESAAHDVLAIPVHPHLTERQLAHVVASVVAFYD